MRIPIASRTGWQQRGRRAGKRPTLNCAIALEGRRLSDPAATRARWGPGGHSGLDLLQRADNGVVPAPSDTGLRLLPMPVARAFAEAAARVEQSSSQRQAMHSEPILTTPEITWLLSSHRDQAADIPEETAIGWSGSASCIALPVARQGSSMRVAVG